VGSGSSAKYLSGIRIPDEFGSFPILDDDWVAWNPAELHPDCKIETEVNSAGGNRDNPCYRSLVLLRQLYRNQWSGRNFDRLRLGTGLLITCYCLTHISLLMLAYRKESSNLLLILTGGVVTLSGISYIIVLWGIVPGENFALVLMGTISLFFIKFALTVTTVLLSLNYPKKPATDDQLKSFPTQPAAKLNI